MASILLNEMEPQRRQWLRTQLQRQGHRVWVAQHLPEIVATLHEVAIDLMILDLDQQRLDELVAFAERWRGITILFQASTAAVLQDFRSWMADDFVHKQPREESVVPTVQRLLHKHAADARPAARSQQPRTTPWRAAPARAAA